MLKTKIKASIKSFFTPNIIAAVVGVFIIRFVLSFLPSFQVDMGTWIAWAGRLSTGGLSHFYSDATWTQYTPGFLYWLWFVGKIGWFSPLAIKIPVIIFDILTGFLIWKLIGKVNLKFANYSFFLYVLNPLVIFDGSVWGQIDGILTFFVFLSAYLLIEKKNTYLSWVLAGLAFLVKPQAIAVLPFLGLITLLNFGWKKLIPSVIAGVTTVILGSVLFFPDNPIFGLFDLVK
ncbi:MAG: glycosyltransferase family 39 protein, partial [Microgenomates group bacterium]